MSVVVQEGVIEDEYSFVDEYLRSFLKGDDARTAERVFHENEIKNDVLPLLTATDVRSLELSLGLKVRILKHIPVPPKPKPQQKESSPADSGRERITKQLKDCLQSIVPLCSVFGNVFQIVQKITAFVWSLIKLVFYYTVWACKINVSSWKSIIRCSETPQTGGVLIVVALMRLLILLFGHWFQHLQVSFSLSIVKFFYPIVVKMLFVAKIVFNYGLYLLAVGPLLCLTRQCIITLRNKKKSQPDGQATVGSQPKKKKAK